MSPENALNFKKIIEPILMAGSEVLPIIEGGKGIGVTNGITAGNFAKCGAVGTFSGVNAQYIDDNGVYHPIIYMGKTRKERHEELVEYGIKAAISQAKRAFDIAGKAGKIHMNVLWEMGGASRVLHGVLEKAKDLINGITCGAGMPYKLSEIADKYKVHYYPIVSSMRAFRALWKRSYSKCKDLLGGVVYECPWKAGGHNGLSNGECPNSPEEPYQRVAEIRQFMNEIGLQNVPIIIAGGVWHIKDFEHYLNNPEIGSVAFQFGTRPIYTQEYEVSAEWKKRLFTLSEGDVYLNRFSPTGFYSSAVNNNFIQNLRTRSERQIQISDTLNEFQNTEYKYGPRRRIVYISAGDAEKTSAWKSQGYTEELKTPDNTFVFVNPSDKETILADQRDCMGCLSGCKFSNWSEHNESHSTGQSPDPRSFCIQKTLQNAFHTSDIENNLMFAGYNAFKFKDDTWYQNGAFVPTIKELIERIQTGY